LLHLCIYLPRIPGQDTIGFISKDHNCKRADLRKQKPFRSDVSPSGSLLLKDADGPSTSKTPEVCGGEVASLPREWLDPSKGWESGSAASETMPWVVLLPGAETGDGPKGADSAADSAADSGAGGSEEAAPSTRFALFLSCLQAHPVNYFSRFPPPLPGGAYGRIQRAL